MKNTYLNRLHPDFHVTPDAIVGEGFNGEEYVKKLKEHGTDLVVFFGKCHYGHSYYPTEVGTVHPNLKTDMLGEVSDACKKYGLGFGAYMSVFLDTAAGQQHPDWLMQTTFDKDLDYSHYRYLPMCVNSPYIKEHFLPQSIEIVTKYHVDELFYDTMSRFTPCYCEHCKKAFGREIPKGPEDDTWSEYVHFYEKRYADFFADTAEAVHEANPDVGVIFNWKWTVRDPEVPPKYITRLAADSKTSGSVASMHGRYMAGTGLPFDYMCGRFLYSLTEWVSSTDESILYSAAGSIAQGGGYFMIDRQLPDGSLVDDSYEAMDLAFSFVNDRREAVEGTKHVSEIAVLHSNTTLVGDDLQFFPQAKERQDRQDGYTGTYRVLKDNGIHFTALCAENLLKRISEYKVIILPEQEYLDDATTQAIEEWVQEGGRLLLSQPVKDQRFDPAILSLAGVEGIDFPDLDYGFFDGDKPFHFRSQFARVKPGPDTEIIMNHLKPMNVGEGGKRFGHGMAPPSDEADYPAVTLRKAGKGEVIYIAAPVFKCLLHYPNHYVKGLAVSLLDRLLPDPMVRITTKAFVETVLLKKDNDLIINLVNHSGKERLGGYHWTVTEFIPELYDIPVRIKDNGNISSIKAIPGGTSADFTLKDGYAVVNIPKLWVMESLILKNYFQNE